MPLVMRLAQTVVYSSSIRRLSAPPDCLLPSQLGVGKVVGCLLVGEGTRGYLL